MREPIRPWWNALRKLKERLPSTRAMPNIVSMAAFARSPITAVLGPTNTGKTHLAVERMAAHSSGVIGFPLRLLAREIYDRLVAMKGPGEVALVTGEERIVPPGARWFCCTAESMPVRGGREGEARDFAFVAIDEAQLGADRERGYVFTDRLLHARGREETMILGSASIAPLVRNLVPDAEIIDRPRFSTLSYAGAKKLSRLPRRSAIVAFSAEEVYAVAEMLRRQRGGAAVVMGALSPRTRNAQVAMFQAGEVDYLVATDAIGMGLNMDVAHVAFASLTKFDGYRTRRLTITEMAQIAGRAGRHQRDGTFGTLGGEGSAMAFTPEEIERIEQHRFPRVEALYWRDGQPDTSSIDALIAALEERPDRPGLMAAPEAIDLCVLKRLSEDPEVRDSVRGPRAVARLWEVCGLPDFQKVGADHHARMVARLWQYRARGNGHISRDWFAQNVARLDNVQGDVETLASRIAATRTWAYIAQRADWLENPAEMAERTVALEERLSDALHAALTQRFVDRRTAVLLRDLKGRGGDMPLDLDDNGDVSMDGVLLGNLSGFRFAVDGKARGSDRKLLLSTAQRRLGEILRDRVAQLEGAPDTAFALHAPAGEVPAICWQGHRVATLGKGAGLLSPAVVVDPLVSAIGSDVAARVRARLLRWIEAGKARHLAPLLRLAEGAADAEVSPALRSVLAQLGEAGGVAPRQALDGAIAGLDRTARHRLHRGGVVIGVLDIYHSALLKPGAMQWRAALLAARRGEGMPILPPAGAAMFHPVDAGAARGAREAGYRDFCGDMLRVDLAEKIARAAHHAIEKHEPFLRTDPQIVSLGLSDAAFHALMKAAGFRPIQPSADDGVNWRFSGRPRARADRQDRGNHGRKGELPRRPGHRPSGAFAELAGMMGLNG